MAKTKKVNRYESSVKRLRMKKPPEKEVKSWKATNESEQLTSLWLLNHAADRLAKALHPRANAAMQRMFSIRVQEQLLIAVTYKGKPVE